MDKERREEKVWLNEKKSMKICSEEDNNIGINNEEAYKKNK